MPYIEIEVKNPHFIRQFADGTVVIVAEVGDLEYDTLKERVDTRPEHPVINFDFRSKFFPGNYPVSTKD